MKFRLIATAVIVLALLLLYAAMNNDSPAPPAVGADGQGLVIK